MLVCSRHSCARGHKHQVSRSAQVNRSSIGLRLLAAWGQAQCGTDVIDQCAARSGLAAPDGCHCYRFLSLLEPEGRHQTLSHCTHQPRVCWTLGVTLSHCTHQPRVCWALGVNDCVKHISLTCCCPEALGSRQHCIDHCLRQATTCQVSLHSSRPAQVPEQAFSCSRFH
jgi:hypothetical protein